MTKRKNPKDLLDVGAPSKYKPEYAQLLIDFFKNCEVVKEIHTVTSGSNGKGSEWSKDEVRYEALDFPTLELFACEIDVDDNTLVLWANAKYPDDYRIKAKQGLYKYPEFRAAYSRAKNIQKGKLVKNAMTGKLHAGFAQFFAINNLGMLSAKEENTQQITVTTRKHRKDDK